MKAVQPEPEPSKKRQNAKAAEKKVAKKAKTEKVDKKRKSG